MSISFRPVGESTKARAKTRLTTYPARNGPGFQIYRRIGKRALDVGLVVLALPAILPIILFFAVLCALDGGNPFFLQRRVGRDNRSFGMLKLRTMVPNAEKKLAGILASDQAARAEWDKHQKLQPDPRVTPVGRFMRKYSIDELPQLFNVLRGDMSLVGPRPMLPEQRWLYPGRAYYKMRPGITGLWQISDRNEVSFAARAGYDDTYKRVLSLKTDFRILLATVGVVVHGTGC